MVKKGWDIVSISMVFWLNGEKMMQLIMQNASGNKLEAIPYIMGNNILFPVSQNFLKEYSLKNEMQKRSIVILIQNKCYYKI